MDINKYLLKDKYDGAKTNEYYNDIKLLEKGVPLAYVIGYVDFLNTKINLRYKPLIPRPETEYWVEKIIGVIQNYSKKPVRLKILDIFCGSGCIGIALLKNIPNCKVIFSDISENAIKQTEYNLKLNRIDTERYEIIKSNLFQNLNQFQKDKFDYIFANPPYVSKNDHFDESLKYEPAKALFAKNNGMQFIEKFLQEAPGYIKKDGKVYMEFGTNQKARIEKLIDAEFHKDQFNKWRWAGF